MIQIKQTEFTVKTSGRELIEITHQVAKIVSNHSIQQGLCHLFLTHTSASLLLCENADSDVRRDLEDFMQTLIPDANNMFRHTTEGKDDMPAHIRTILTQNSIQIPISNSKLMLGTWQGIFLWEHRFSPHTRKLIQSMIGDFE